MNDDTAAELVDETVPEAPAKTTKAKATKAALEPGQAVILNNGPALLVSVTENDALVHVGQFAGEITVPVRKVRAATAEELDTHEVWYAKHRRFVTV